MDRRKCSKCQRTLAIEKFYKRTGHKTHHSACKECERGMAKDWYQRNREKSIETYKKWRLENLDRVKAYRVANRQKNYRHELRRKHGVSLEWFDEQIAKQSNQCACCRVEFAFGNKQTTPHVDHCHNSKAVRGILCNRCNTVLGLTKDDDKLLMSMVGYLRKSRKCRGSSAKR